MAYIVLLVGIVLVCAMVAKALFDKIKLPPETAYMGIGLCARILDNSFGVVDEQMHLILESLAALGVIALLFRIGLKSDLGELRKQLSRASIIWLVQLVVSFVIGFVATRYLLGFNFIPSLITGVAFTATSVGITGAVWRRHDALNTECGEMFLDVAELDDVGGVVMMGVLFAMLPVLHDSGESSSLWLTGSKTFGLLLLKLAVITTACGLFARYLEKPITTHFCQLETPPDPMLFVAGIGIVIAALTGLSGFSVAIGAFFAGLAFSRDPETTKMSDSFSSIHDFLVPFFFFGIGFSIRSVDPMVVLGIGALLVAMAAISKIIGNYIPAVMMMDSRSAKFLSIGMIARAEITMIIMQRGMGMGDWAVPNNLFAAMVCVSAVTAVGTPIVLDIMFRRYPLTNEGDNDNEERS